MLSSKANSAAPTGCLPSWMSAMLHRRMPAQRLVHMSFIIPRAQKERQEQALIYTTFQQDRSYNLRKLMFHGIAPPDHSSPRMTGM